MSKKAINQNTNYDSELLSSIDSNFIFDTNPINRMRNTTEDLKKDININENDKERQLNELKLQIFKIPSGEITNLPYLKHIGKLNKKIILSTGMSNMSEVKEALDILINSGTKKNNIIVLHANTEYPTPMKDVNLRAMISIGKELDIVLELEKI